MTCLLGAPLAQLVECQTLKRRDMTEKLWNSTKKTTTKTCLHVPAESKSIYWAIIFKVAATGIFYRRHAF